MRLVKITPASKLYETWRKELVKQVGPVNDERANEYSKAVSLFSPKTRPQFRGVIVDRGGTVFIRVILENGSKVINKYGTTIRQLWQIWNEGSRPHDIRPRFAKILRFIGKAGNRVFTPLVRHPGTKGSKAKKRIDKRFKPLEKYRIGRAGRIAFKKLRDL